MQDAEVAAAAEEVEKLAGKWALHDRDLGPSTASSGGTEAQKRIQIANAARREQ